MRFWSSLFFCLCSTAPLFADEPVAENLLEPRLIHLRSAAPREWSDFPEQPDAARIDIEFRSATNPVEWSLLLRQQDVKQAWRVSLNDKPLGELVRDENDTSIALAVPADALNEGINRLQISARSNAADLSDDIRVGDIRLVPAPVREVLSPAVLDVDVRDSDTRQPTPCRITIVNADGALQVLGIASSDELAVRPGVVYTSRGRARIELPAGEYTICAGRGFEYSLARTEVSLKAGPSRRVALTVRREVPTDGYVACDTHLHTLTHSGHGDASVAERLITLAGEGIELPIATDHNQQIDYEPLARQLGVRRFFTPIVGNEVTTPRGHFNVFPVSPDGTLPEHRQTSWAATFESIGRSGARVAILNHARDVHSQVRPFGPLLFNDAVGEHFEDWPALLNAMEVVNSGATQTDVLQLFRDWMTLLNRGRPVTPVGSSDSHDVSRYIPGQGRTYVRVDDRDPSKIDRDAVIESFVQGHVMVSYGLLAELTVNGRFRSGDLAPRSGNEWNVSVRVLGPHWVDARQLLLFANGQLIRDVTLPAQTDPSLPTGVKWAGTWRVPVRKHDVHLVAIALGPGVKGLYWPTAKPYQPTSPDSATHVIGCSGAVWLDNDGDGQSTTARATAERLFAPAIPALPELMRLLGDCDAAVAAQAAFLLEKSGQSLTADEFRLVLQNAAPSTREGFHKYQSARRAMELARAAAQP